MTPQQLFHHCDSFVPNYPTGTVELGNNYPVAGAGFFPVASGSFHSACLNTLIGTRKLMFVGQDWGCVGNLRALAHNPNADIQSGTGKILLDLLVNQTQIPLKDCFFTNALWGVRKGDTNTGPSPGWKCRHFSRNCANALKEQIAVVQPKGIICLGREAPRVLRSIVSECAGWRSAGSFRAIDAADSAVVNVTSLPGVKVAAILLHPSFRIPNLKHRSYGGFDGHQAELEILADVWSRV